MAEKIQSIVPKEKLEELILALNSCGQGASEAGCAQLLKVVKETLYENEGISEFAVFSQLIQAIRFFSFHFNTPLEEIFKPAGFVLK